MVTSTTTRRVRRASIVVWCGDDLPQLLRASPMVGWAKRRRLQLNGFVGSRRRGRRRHRDAQWLRVPADRVPQLQTIAAQLHGADEATRDRLMGQSSGRRAVEPPRSRSWDASHTVTQVYCSALPSRLHVDSGGRGTPFALSWCSMPRTRPRSQSRLRTPPRPATPRCTSRCSVRAPSATRSGGCSTPSNGRGACTPTTASTCTSCRTGRAGWRSTC